jgi:hypothetical protein
MDEYIRLDTTIIGIDNLISKASTVEEANALFKAKDVIYSQERHPTYRQPDNGWISVKDRLPEYDKTVLVVNEDGYMHTAVRIKGSIARIDEWQIKFGVYFIDNDVWEEDEQGKITHWQPLPEPPKEEDYDLLLRPNEE